MHDSDDTYYSARYLAKLRRRVDELEEREDGDDIPNPVRALDERAALADTVTATSAAATRGVWDRTGTDGALVGDDTEGDRVWGP